MIISKDAIKNILSRILKLNKKLDSHKHNISDVNNLQTTLDGKSPTSHNHDSVYVKQDGSTPITSRQQLKMGSYVFEAHAGNGTEGYALVAEFKISKNYQNTPIKIELARRGVLYSNITIQFRNTDSPDPTLQNFVYEGSDCMAYIVKADTSTWNLYIRKTEGYDVIFITKYSNPNSAITTIWKESVFTSLPEGGTYATPLQHAISEITDLQSTLDKKAPINYVSQFEGGAISSNFRKTIIGTTDMCGFAKSFRKNDSTDACMPQYGSGIAWGQADTHGMLCVDYINPTAYVAGGNGNKLNWYKQIAWKDDLTSYSLKTHNHDTVYSKLGHTHTISNVTGLQDKLDEVFQSVSNGKTLLETAITDKGSSVSKVGNVATFEELKTGIAGISNGNIFVQQDEPTTKTGLWLKTSNTYNDIINISNTEYSAIYTKLTDIPYMFVQGSVVAVGDDIYLLGGSNSKKYNYKYDTTTNTYTKMTDIPYKFSKGSAVYIGNDIYLLGGIDSNYNNYKYNITTDTYTKLTNIPYEIYDDTAVSIGNDIYLLSGNYDYKKYNYKYNTITNTYTKMTDIPYEFYYGYTVAIGSNIYLLGGYNEYNNYKYDTTNNTYTKLTDIPYRFVYGSVAAIGNDIYLLGDNYNKKYNYKYNTTTDTYTRMTDIPYNFSEGTSVAIGNDIYLLGGDYNEYNNNYKYDTTVLSYKNSILILYDNESFKYKTKIFNTPYGGLNYINFDSVIMTDENGNNINVETYIGNGTSWNKI